MIRKKKKENIRESLDGRKKKKCFGCWLGMKNNKMDIINRSVI